MKSVSASTLHKYLKYCRFFPILAVLAACTAVIAIGMVIAIYRHRILDLDFRFSSPFTEDELRSLNLTMSTLLSVLNRLNVTYFMNSGTLLGSYRHHGRIPWDDDVDLMVNSSDKKPIYRALTALEPDYRLFVDDGTKWKFYCRLHGRRIPSHPYVWPFVDLLFFGYDAKHIWTQSPDFRDRERWPRSVIFPLRPRPFNGFMIPAPCNVEKTLAVLYDVNVCASRHYSHIYERPTPVVAVRCARLAHRYAMVVRRSTATNASRRVVSESLVLGNHTLHTITLEDGC